MSNPNSPFVQACDFVNPQTGRTYRQENLELKHNIPLGTLVEVKSDDWFGDGACIKYQARLWVVRHSRDCDGTPLYAVSRWKDPEFAKQHGITFFGFEEKDLNPIEITDELRRGEGALQWGDDEAENDL